MTASEPSAVLRLTLEGPITVYEAVATKAKLLHALEKCQLLELDLAQVTEFDSAGFQLLALVFEEAKRAGKRVQLVAQSSAVRDVIDFYRAERLFGDPVILSSSPTPTTKGQRHG